MSQNDYLQYRRRAMQWANLDNANIPSVQGQGQYLALKSFAALNSVPNTKNSPIDNVQNTSALLSTPQDGAGQCLIMGMLINDGILKQSYPLPASVGAGYACKVSTCPAPPNRKLMPAGNLVLPARYVKERLPTQTQMRASQYYYCGCAGYGS